MKTPRVFIAYAPRGIGLRCAVAYLSAARDVYGWYIGPGEDCALASAYFLLEHFYAAHDTRYVAVQAADLYSGWTQNEALRHELVRLQQAFAGEWLFYRDAAHAAELDAYARAELAIGELNIRYARLSRLSKLQPNWIYFSPEFERPVLDELMEHWPLEYRGE